MEVQIKKLQYEFKKYSRVFLYFMKLIFYYVSTNCIFHAIGSQLYVMNKYNKQME